MAVSVAWQYVDLGQHIRGYDVSGNVPLQLALKIHVAAVAETLFGGSCWTRSIVLHSAEQVWRLCGRTPAVSAEWLDRHLDIDFDQLGDLQQEIELHVQRQQQQQRARSRSPRPAWVQAQEEPVQEEVRSPHTPEYVEGCKLSFYFTFFWVDFKTLFFFVKNSFCFPLRRLRCCLLACRA